MSIGKNYTYWQFIQEFGVSIPVIQRDYAQGREGKEDLRRRFLGNLKDALDENKQLILDFVYGVRDKNENIIPLDGQQRLTTLWLLHWYLYLKSNNKISKDNLTILRKLTYQTRMSSRKFCEELCDYNHFKALRNQDNGNIRECILSQTWFMTEWEQDPTVKAMLNMLGGVDNSIESIFKEKHKDYWNQLKEEGSCPIQFYFLSIDGEIFQRPDDLYIKVNARGEHLTDFENFKADLIKYVRDNQDKWKVFGKNPELGLSKLIDNDWTDIFWNNLPKKQRVLSESSDSLPSVDRQFFAFLNRFFVNKILCDLKISEKDMAKFGTDQFTYPDSCQDDNCKKKIDGQIRLFKYLYSEKESQESEFAYKDFKIYRDGGVITPENFNTLNKIFKNVKALKLSDIQPSWKEERRDSNENDIFKNKFKFLPCKSNNGILDDISQRHRVVFFGICCYLDTCTSYSSETFKEWMRFVWNMAYNSDVQNIENMKNVIQKINNVKDNCCQIIEHLVKETPSDKDSYMDRQWDEEIKKAKIINNDYNKKEEIIKAEKTFHGSIRFLIKDDNLLKLKTAKSLLQKDDWILKILLYFPINKFNAPKHKSVIFAEKGKRRDVVDIINRDELIIEAVQNILTNNHKTEYEDSWIKTIEDIPSLLNYSSIKKIQKYFGWNNKPECVYLYKRSNWKKEDCIILYSNDPTLQGDIKKRNDFIKGKLQTGFSLDNGIDDDKCYPKDENKHYGRAIVITDKTDKYYCHPDKYVDGTGQEKEYQ